MGNNHSYAIFNSGRNPVIHTNQDVNFDDNMLNLEYIEILSHPFDEIILPTIHNLITTNFDFQLIKDTIENQEINSKINLILTIVLSLANDVINQVLIQTTQRMMPMVMV